MNKPIMTQIVNQYPVLIHEAEEGGFWVECPTIDGCYSQGESIDEALINIKEAIQLSFEDLAPEEKKRASHDVGLHFVKL